MDRPPLGASKDREFGYRWSQFWTRAAAVLIVFGIWWKTDDLWPEGIPFVAAFSLIYVGWAAFPLRRVTLTETEIRIDFLFPFRKDRRFDLDHITSYDEIRVKVLKKNNVIGGILGVTGERNRIMIMEAHTRNFEGLNRLLRDQFPASKKPAENSSTP